MLNVTLQETPVSLTYCTLCNAPILYDCRVDSDIFTFGSSGMLASGNKVMYDEETETLWDQHAGTPIAGPYFDRDPRVILDQFAVTQTTWGEWYTGYPETLALDIETDYDYNYEHYDDNIGFFRHYWDNEAIIQPGVRRDDDGLPEKADVYGIVSEDASEAWVIPIEDFEDPFVGMVGDQRIVAVRDPTGDIAVYEAPPVPVERRADGLLDAEETEWKLTRNELRSTTGETLSRVTGRHGLWFAFRTHYNTAHVLS